MVRSIRFIVLWSIIMACVVSPGATNTEEATGNETLQIVSHRFLTDGEIKENDWRLEITFSHPVPLLRLYNFIMLEQNGTPQRISFKSVKGAAAVSAGEDQDSLVTTVVIAPAAVVAARFQNKIKISAGLIDASGDHVLLKDWLLEFTSETTFTITSIEPSDKEDRIKVHFSDWVTLDRFRKNLKINPFVSLRWYDSHIDKNKNILNLRGNFERGRTYLITLPADFRSNSDKLYSKTKYRFTMPDQAPAIKFEQKGNIIERDSRQLLSIQLMNVDEVLFEGISIPPILAPMVSGYLSKHLKKRSQKKIPPEQDALNVPDLNHFLEETNQKLVQKAASFPEYQTFLGEYYEEKQLFFRKSSPNEWQNFSMPLTFRKNKKKGGIEVIRLLNNKGHSQTDFRVFRITDIGLTVKRSGSALLLWATSLRTGQPLADVSVLAYTRDSAIHAVGKTDGQGILLIDPDASYPTIKFNTRDEKNMTQSPVQCDRITNLVASTPDDCSYLEIGSTGYLKLPGIDHRNFQAGKSTVLKGYVFTERGIYRPGATVHFKGFIREYAQGEIRTPSEYTCRLLINDARNEEYYRHEMTISKFGTISGEITLNSYDPLGTYTLFIKDKSGKKVLAKRSFQVQEFRAPRHYADITFKQGSRPNSEYINWPRQEQYLTCNIKGNYYAGGPLKHGQVRWKTYFAGTKFKVAAQPDFTFGYPGDFQKDLLESGDSMLDEKGDALITVPLNQSVLSGLYSLEMTASVIDFDGRVASTTEVYQIQPDFLVGIRNHKKTVDVGDNQQLTLIVVDRKGKIIKTGKVTVDVFQQGWSYVRKRNQYGNIYWASHRVWRRSYSQGIHLNNGTALFDFDFAMSGQYLIKVSYTHQEQTFVSGTTYNVQGYYYGYDYESRSKPYEKIDIIPDKSEYEVGDIMKVKIRSGKPIKHALLTIEQESILQEKYISALNETINITLSDSSAPNVYISVLGIIPRGEFPIYKEQYDSESPTFVFGTTQVAVKQKIQKMALSINMDREFSPALPGSELSFQLATTDGHGRGVQSEIAVCVVDERVLALTAFTTPTLDKFLRFQKPLAVFTFESRLNLLKQTPFELLQNQPLTGGGGFRAGQDIPSQIRKNFNPVAYFNPGLITDEAGMAVVKCTLPDTMTTYRVYAVACDPGARFATSQKALKVVKDFYLEPGLPRFFRTGDSFSCYISAFNKTESHGPVKFQAQSDENISLSKPEGTFQLGSFDRVLLPLEGTAIRAGTATMTFSGFFQNRDDALKIDVPLHSPYVFTTDYVFGTFTSQTDITYSFPDGTTGIPFQELEEDSVEVLLILSGSPFLRLSGGFRYLLKYPYGCIEQTSSGVMPLAALRDLVEKELIYSITLEETDVFINSGVERLLSMQTESGGFSYWPGHFRPNKWGTLYALAALTMAEKSGVEIPADRLRKAHQYLVREIMEHPKQNHIFKAMAAYLLALKNNLSEQTFQLVSDNLENQPRQAANLCLLAAYHMNYMAPDKLEATLRRVLDKPDEYAGADYFYAHHREKAIATLAASTILPHSQVANQEAQRLLGGINRRGIWTSTADTGWALLALGKFFSESSFNQDELKVTITYAGGEPQTFMLDPKRNKTISFPAQAFWQKPKLSVSVEPEATLLYQLVTKFPRIDYQKAGYQNGFEIEKTIKNTDGSDTIRLGDIVEVTIKISIPERSYRFIALNDPLPAGLVAINSALKTEESVDDGLDRGEGYWWNYWDPKGYYRFRPNHFEIRDDRVLVFKDYAWPSSYQYSYYARAVCPGSFTVPSTFIQLMYSPKICAYTPSKKITILPQQ
ncbi:alpha-2-macroglobulin [candidate division CSSED10-310 bacterium]|uniref:Alpha-2-macroglobulin n=1 Tax=candidate division CSSED10-310 bacterium TaxID=2855610 RepID=A0ABV6YY09_UNCC1